MIFFLDDELEMGLINNPYLNFEEYHNSSDIIL